MSEVQSLLARGPARVDQDALCAWLTTRPIAHRGLHSAGAPENTLAAFEAARAENYPIELDVHVLRDGEPIVFHDADLLRATGVARSLRDEDRDSIRRHRLFSGPHTIPNLRDVLQLIDGKVPLLIELKASAWAPRPRGVLDALRGYRGAVALQSFDPWTLRWFREHAPELPRGQLAGPLRDDAVGRFQRVASRRLLAAAVSRPHFLNYDLRALPDPWIGLVARAARLPLLCWTVRSDADRRRAEQLGLNYVFDHVRP